MYSEATVTAIDVPLPTGIGVTYTQYVVYVPTIPPSTNTSTASTTLNIGAIVGGAVGGFVALSAAGFGIFFKWPKLKKDKNGRNGDNTLADTSDHAYGNYNQSWQPLSGLHSLSLVEARYPVEVEAKHGQSEANAAAEVHEVSA